MGYPRLQKQTNMEDIIEIIPKAWFDRGTALKVVKYYFKNGRKLIRIATGFFSVRGYNLLRSSANEKQMYILVGVDDPGKDRVRKALVQEIMQDLRRGIDENRREAVRELVEKLEIGDFRIIDARAKDHHAKLYLVDDCIALVSSSNVSQRGMIDAIEAGYVVDEQKSVQLYLEQFDKHFFAPDSWDITQDLLNALKRWLGMASPWEIYLKTLLALKDLEEIPETRPTYKNPVGYQNDVIARLLRQIDEYNGAMLVASTGLGKTVIATDLARRMKINGKIDNVLLIGPEPVRDSWRKHFRPAGITPEYFNHSALDVIDFKRNQFAGELNEILEDSLDERWLVVIDESHELRNRYKYRWEDNNLVKQERSAFEMLHRTFEKAKCKVLLLTATPYAKELNNINNQLHLLPHTSSSHALLPNEVKDSHAWMINEIRELKESPPVSVITTPYVSRYYGVKGKEGIHINFNGLKQYIPHVVLFAAYTPILCEEQMTKAIDNHCFKRKSTRARNQPIEMQARVAWASSPLMLKHVIEQSLKNKDEGGYDVKFMLEKDIRESYLTPILKTISNLKLQDDMKLNTLVEILKEHCIQKKEKVIIFAERLPTIDYLEKAFETLLPNLSIASTVEKAQSGKYQLKDKRTVAKLICDFAPIANHIESENNYDVFIATDAYGVGVNLQDACVVVNYDLSWTPIEPDQRAGRILRFWQEPREVSLYVFVPTFGQESTYKHETLLVQRRWENLISRHGQSKTITDLPTITRKSKHQVNMPTLAGKQNIKKIGEINVEAFDDDQISSSDIFQHTAILLKHREKAKAIPDDIMSAKSYDGNLLLIYMLLSYENKYRWVLYDVKHRELSEKIKDAELLKIIKADKNTPTAGADPILIEKLADKCIRRWCKQNKFDEDNVLRICTMLLVPESMDNFDNLFQE